MNEKSIELILQKLDVLGAKIGVGVEAIWPWFIKQQYIEALTGILLIIAGGLIFYKLILFMRNHWKSIITEGGIKVSRNYSIIDERHEGIWTCSLIIYSFIYIFILFGGIDSIMDLLNVEYQAFRNLLSFVK